MIDGYWAKQRKNAIKNEMAGRKAQAKKKAADEALRADVAQAVNMLRDEDPIESFVGDAASAVGHHFKQHWRDYAGAGVTIAGFTAGGLCGASVVCGAAVGLGAAVVGYATANGGTKNWNWTTLAITGAGGGIGGWAGVRVGAFNGLGSRIALTKLQWDLKIAKIVMKWKWRNL